MKIIKHGNTYREKECPRCGALLSYCKGDIKQEANSDEYFGEFHCFSRAWIVCPECNKEIDLSFIIDGEEI